MRAVVLVGGFGTRLRPLTSHTPKQMLPIVDRPMIEWVLGHIAGYGFDDAVLSLGYRPDDFVAAYPDGCCAGVRLHYAVEPEPLDTAGAIRFAALDAGIHERFVVLNGDILTDLDLDALLAFHDRTGAEATITLHEVNDPSRYGVVPTDAEGRVTAFVEKPAPGEAPTNLINAGTYVLEPSVLDRIDSGRRVSIEREVFPAMVRDGSLYAFPDGGVYWLDAGTPATYIQAQIDLVEGRRVADWPVTAIGAAAVAPSALVEESVVADDVAIAADAEVIRSIVHAGATIGAKARVVDSVVGAAATIGEGATVEALSLIGEGQFVAPGSTLQGVRMPEPQS